MVAMSGVPHYSHFLWATLGISMFTSSKVRACAGAAERAQELTNQVKTCACAAETSPVKRFFSGFRRAIAAAAKNPQLTPAGCAPPCG